MRPFLAAFDSLLMGPCARLQGRSCSCFLDADTSASSAFTVSF